MKSFELSNIKLDGRKKEAPEKIRLFKWGENKTSKGIFILTYDDALEVMKQWGEYGNRLNFDYNHAQLSDASPDNQISAGNFDLEILEDGLYAINIEWTSKAKQLIENKEYLYISPAFITFEDDKNNMHINSIINVALTNIPATFDMDQLLAASKVFEEKLNMENKLEEEEVENVEKLSELPQEIEGAKLEALENSAKNSEEEIEQLEEEAPVSDLEARLTALEALVEELMKAAPEVTQAEETASETLSIEVPSEIEKLSQENSKLKEQVEQFEKERIVMLGINDGKILPSQKNVFMKLSIVDLKSEIEMIPSGAISNMLSNRQQAEAPKQENSNIVALKNKYAKQLGLKIGK
jgi:phage I-like protein